MYALRTQFFWDFVHLCMVFALLRVDVNIYITIDSMFNFLKKKKEPIELFRHQQIYRIIFLNKMLTS